MTTSTSSPAIRVRCLGAGQDVGRSCVLVTLDDAFCVMFDCGMHMGFNDSRR
jgi:integrator complex subunit 11